MRDQGVKNHQECERTLERLLSHGMKFMGLRQKPWWVPKLYSGRISLHSIVPGGFEVTS